VQLLSGQRRAANNLSEDRIFPGRLLEYEFWITVSLASLNLTHGHDLAAIAPVVENLSGG
jgi:hypothetical protein